jgi:hypothetical protein
MRSTKSAAVFTIVAALVALGGCNSSSTSNPPPPPLCGAPSGPVSLAYPAPGSTGIPDNFSGVIFVSKNGLYNSYQAWLALPGASLPVVLQPVANAPTPLPSPLATPSYANPIYQMSSSGAVVLPAASKIGVYLNNANSSCTASYQGSFTTQ